MLSVELLKKSFFDREAVKNALDDGARKGLSRFGAFVRQRDKSSLKYRKKSAEPGMPPSVHRSIGFTRKKKKKDKKTGLTTESQQPSSPLRELTFFAYDAAEKSVVIGPAGFRSKVAGPGVIPAIIEAAHPHTGPAFAAELPRAAEQFKNMIGR